MVLFSCEADQEEYDLQVRQLEVNELFLLKMISFPICFRFSIVNLIKSDSLYNEGMRPVMYSNTNAKTKNVGWKRCGDNICYYRNDDE